MNLTLHSDSLPSSPRTPLGEITRVVSRRKSTMNTLSELTNEAPVRRILQILTPQGQQALDIGLVEEKFLQHIHLPIHIRSILYHKEIQNALNSPTLPPLDVFRNGSAMLWSFLSRLVNVDVDNQHKLKLIQAVAEVSKGIIIGMVNKQAYGAVIMKLDGLSGSSGEFREFISGVGIQNNVETGRRRSSTFQPDDVPEEFTADIVPGGVDECLAELRERTRGVDTLRFLLNFKTFKNHCEIYGADEGLPELFEAHLPAFSQLVMSKEREHDEKVVQQANTEAINVLAGGLELQKYSVSLDVFEFMANRAIRILPPTMAYCISLGVLYRAQGNRSTCLNVDPAVPDLKPVQ
ncbi:MAG: uncharacterized protein KVP18_003775 [Porospora cf. gigantea A]|uniref:uncharacterized protein n=2 Tax=Porospora cf. gigantea A TaxID=2853593 RepID=UPI00355A44AC|nr:MAG: hypothetical protein KVP18_003775 [Porospora cf. gigantea A]